MSISGVRPSMPLARPALATTAQATAPATPPKAMPPVKAVTQPSEWTVGRVFKTGASAAGGFVGGSVVTFVADLFFHFGNNGGTAWPGGVYLMAAGAVALGAAALYAKLSAK